MVRKELPIPAYYREDKVGEVWKVDYEQRANDALGWANKYNIKPSFEDKFKVCILAVDVQNTFCIPGYELFVGGRSGIGAVEDTNRLCSFIYRNLDQITEIIPTMDTHHPLQIFHSIFLLNDKGEHPKPYTLITSDDVEKGLWRINDKVCKNIGVETDDAENYLLHYTQKLKEGNKYSLTIWPYHAMLGGIGNALVPALDEAIFFHSIARYSQPDFQVKGNNPFTEHYSIFGPEVREGSTGNKIADKNTSLLEKLLGFDAIIIAGQAKSHCVAWTIEDLLNDFLLREKHLTGKVYLLEDCTSPVVVPGVIDYTDEANKSFQKFADAGMHIVKSTDSIKSWPGMNLQI